MKKILLPTDFSFNSKNAISYAMNFYKEDLCEFTLLHAFTGNGNEQPSNFFTRVENASSIKEKDSEKKLNMLLQEIKMRYPNSKHSFRKVARNLPLLSVIKKEVENSPYDLIVIGTQGITNLKDVAFGANTRHILENITSCPIMAIPSHVKFSQIKEIVLATGFKTHPRQQEYTFIKDLINRTKAVLRILYIEDNRGLKTFQIKNKEILYKIFEGVPVTFHSLAHVSVPVGIYCFTESRSSDLITFINKKHSFFENVLFNPLYKNLGNYSKIPILIIQTGQKNNIQSPGFDLNVRKKSSRSSNRLISE
ncbi:MAG TPA: universal stress protein [Gillisia sp.]|nr:universal stress protein [Gillisia sp.]